MEPFALHGDRVLLSVPTMDDADRITELCQDPGIQEWTTVPSPYTRAHAEVFVRDFAHPGWTNGTSLTWAIRDPRSQQVIGMIGVGLSGDGKGEVGFWLAPGARGQGVMSTAIRQVASRLFVDPTIGVTHLIWWAYVGNWASRRVAWAIGFRHEGLVRGGQPQRGSRRDAWVATLCAGDPMRPASRWLDMPEIRGDRVLLRPFRNTDIDAVVEACEDPITQRWLGGIPRPYSREHALAYVRGHAESAAAGRGVTWAAANPDGGPALGSFALALNGPSADQASVGYWVHPAARHSGVATEATRLMVRHAFIPTYDGGLGLRRLMVEHAEGNEPSRRVIEHAGFRHTGVERAAVPLPDGSFASHHRYDLLVHEFA